MVLSGKATLAGVMGWPVGHSLSPRLHGYWLDRYKIDGAYIPLAVAPKDFAKAVRMLPRLGFAGVNVTLPHKEAAMRVADHVTPAARRMGAVNTVVVQADGTLRGDNTDGFGFLENLAAAHPDWRADRGPAVVLGAGGAARALCATLLEAGAPEVRLINRTEARAMAVARAIGAGVRVFAWADTAKALAGAALLINTTTLGMKGNPELSIDLAALPITAVVTDAVYVPLETALLKSARNRGNPVVDGLGMLLHQARPGFRAWFGREPEVTEALRSFVLAGLAAG